jgi:hypothetical protein
MIGLSIGTRLVDNSSRKNCGQLAPWLQFVRARPVTGVEPGTRRGPFRGGTCSSS